MRFSEQVAHLPRRPMIPSPRSETNRAPQGLPRNDAAVRRVQSPGGGGELMTTDLHKLSYMPRERERPWTLGAWVFVILCALQLCTLGYVLVATARITLLGQ